MTKPGLRVTPDGLRKLAQRCQTLSGQVGASLSPVAASAWQSSGAATTAVNAGASNTATALKTRMSSSASKLTRAAHDYETMDDQGAAALTRVGSNLPAGSGTDGGAGGMGAPRLGPLPVHSGGDGGAAGLGIPR